MPVLQQSCPLLHTLSLEDCKITDAGLQAFANGMPKLSHLNLTHGTAYKKITNAGIKYDNNPNVLTARNVGIGCPKLEHIRLSRCVAVGDDGIKSIAENCHTLKCIRLSNCNNIQGTFLEHSRLLFSILPTRRLKVLLIIVLLWV